VTAGTVIAEMRSDGSKSAGSLRFTVYIVGGSKVDEAISVMVFR
jgi:3-phosphoglycerate kinase